MIAAREGFLFTGLLLRMIYKLFLMKTLYLTSNFKSSLIDDFDGLYLEPIDVYPNQVRSDIKKYLNNFDSFFIGRLELNYYKSYERKHFIRFSAGYFEEMYGGVGLDYLFYPQDSLYSFGLELYRVRKETIR